MDNKFVPIYISFIGSFLVLSGCAFAETSLTHKQKLDAITSLKTYDNETSGELLEASKSLPAQKIKSAFICDQQSSDSCELQKFYHKVDNQLDSPVFSVNGKYKVEIGFVNESGLPKMYLGESHFIDKSVEETQQIIFEAFNNYLGNNYEELNPEFLGAGKNGLKIAIFVENVNQLNRFIGDDRVTGIWHIGNNRNIPEER